MTTTLDAQRSALLAAIRDALSPFGDDELIAELARRKTAREKTKATKAKAKTERRIIGRSPGSLGRRYTLPWPA